MTFSRSARSVIQVKTIPEGYNSGRAYFVRFESISCQETTDKLTSLSCAARIRADKRTRFEHNQLQASRSTSRHERGQES